MISRAFVAPIRCSLRTNFLILACTTLFLVICHAPAKGGPSETPEIQFGVPILTFAKDVPRTVVVGDFNGDTHPDMAVITFKTLEIRVGQGDGTFRPGWVFHSDSELSSLVGGDVNGDGKLDLVVATLTDVIVLLGNGDGTFRTPIACQVGPAWSVTAGDFNRDGKLDLAVLEANVGLVILLGRGDGTFQNTPGVYDASGIRSISFADFDGDGVPDLAMADSAKLYIQFGNGDGTFRPPTRFTPGDQLTAVAAGDLNGDGKADFVIGTGSGMVSALLGVGDGTFLPGHPQGPLGQPAYIAVTDLNGDGKLDVAVGTGLAQLTVLLGAGDGTLSIAGTHDVASGPQFIVASDFNHDAKVDLAVLNSYSQTISILLGKGDGSFLDCSYVQAGPNPFGLVAADLNGDGHVDLAVADFYREGGLVPNLHGGVSVLLGKGDGTFQAARENQCGPLPSAVAAADLNGDGKVDLVTANLFATILPGMYQVPPGTVSVLLGHGDGTFENAVDYPAEMQPVAVVIGDFDGDGKADLAVGNAGNPALNWADGSVSILLGRGDGTFLPRTNYPVGGHLFCLAKGDFDGDGQLDLIAGSSAGISFLFGKRLGHFENSPLITTGVTSVAVGDLDGDGVLDLAVTGNGITMLLGKGDGTFQLASRWDPADGFAGVAVADLNGDGTPDLFLLKDTFSFWAAPGQGGARFGSGIPFNGQSTYPVQGANGTTGMALADFDEDGRIDLALANEFHVGVFLNHSPKPPLDLSVFRGANTLELSWPTLFTGMSLEASSSLDPSRWEAVSGTPVQRGGRWQVELSAGTESRFFRLRRP